MFYAQGDAVTDEVREAPEAAPEVPGAAVELLDEIPRAPRKYTSRGPSGPRHLTPEIVAAVSAEPGRWAAVPGYSGQVVSPALKAYGAEHGLAFKTAANLNGEGRTMYVSFVGKD